MRFPWSALPLLLVPLAPPLGAEAPFSRRAEIESGEALRLLMDGKLPGALESGRQALQRRLEDLGPLHPRTALARRDLGVLLWHLARYAEAEAELQQALAVFLREEGEGGESCLRVRLDLGGLYQQRGRHHESAASFLAAYRGASGAARLEAALGAARALARAGQHEQARKLLGEAQGQAAPEEGFALALARGELEMDAGRIAEGLAAYEQARKEGERLFGVQDPRLAPAFRGLAACWEAKGSAQEARHFWELALETQRRFVGIKLAYASLRDQEIYAQLQRKLGHPGEALRVYRQALSARLAFQDAAHPAYVALKKLVSSLEQP